MVLPTLKKFGKTAQQRRARHTPLFLRRAQRFDGHFLGRELVLAGVGVAGLDTPRPSLEDLFVRLTGEGFDVDG